MPDDVRPQRPRALSGTPRLIQRYEAIADATRQMLAAACEDRWDLVAACEDRCKALIAEVKAGAHMERLSEDEQRRRVELLRDILAADAQIRERAEPWIRQLEQMIGTSPRARRGAASDR